MLACGDLSTDSLHYRYVTCQAKRIEAEALNYLRGCFHVDNVNAFYEVRPEAKVQKELARKSQEALFDNFAGTHVDMLLAQFDEEDD